MDLPDNQHSSSDGGSVTEGPLPAMPGVATSPLAAGSVRSWLYTHRTQLIAAIPVVLVLAVALALALWQATIPSTAALPPNGPVLNWYAGGLQPVIPTNGPIASRGRGASRPLSFTFRIGLLAIGRLGRSNLGQFAHRTAATGRRSRSSHAAARPDKPMRGQPKKTRSP
jgi:hypothetical protein